MAKNNSKETYDQVSSVYESATSLPVSQIEQQLVTLALGDCAGKTVLDLGGGIGLHARKAIDLGATLVDNVDISPQMLEDGKAIEASIDHKYNIRWFLGDVSQPLENLPLEGAYDIVLVGWTFNHAESEEQLDGMWKNAALYLKPGGKLINTRMVNPRSKSGESGKYGVSFSDFTDIPGGLKYIYHAQTTPTMSVSATSMIASRDTAQAKVRAECYGLVDYKQVPAERLDVVKNDPEFWKLYLDDPFFICVTATKEA